MRLNSEARGANQRSVEARIEATDDGVSVHDALVETREHLLLALKAVGEIPGDELAGPIDDRAMTGKGAEGLESPNRLE